MLGLYLYQDDARIRILKTLNRLNLVIGYTTLQKRLRELMITMSQKVREFDKLSSTVVT